MEAALSAVPGTAAAGWIRLLRTRKAGETAVIVTKPLRFTGSGAHHADAERGGVRVGIVNELDWGLATARRFRETSPMLKYIGKAGGLSAS